jgi:MinD-like ATPase involved in chromosome partitioning or flagellar assembly
MPLVSLISAKGAPGTTTTALALGAVWPRPVLLADCDPAGGDVALRMPGESGEPLDRDRGLLSLAALSRRGLTGAQVLEHLQRIQGGLDVLAGVRSPEQATASAHLWASLGSALDAMEDVDVLADCGRVDGEVSASVVLPILRASRLVVLVTRPETAGVFHARERIGALSVALRSRAVDGVPLGVLVVAPSADRREVDGLREVLARDNLPVTVLGHVAYDERGAAAFLGHPQRRLDKSMLVRSVHEVAARLAEGLSPYLSSADVPPTDLPSAVTAAEGSP